MTTTVWTTLIAVVGTLSAGLLTSVLKNRSDRTARRVERLFDNQDNATNALGDLLDALGRHYVAMWDLEAARVRGDQAEIDETLNASIATRSALTRPHLLAKLLVPDLAKSIDGAVRAVYDMDSATDTTRSEESLTARRLRAKAAHDDLIQEATQLLQRAGVGLSAS